MTHFKVWTENPRVGGSIPPLATMNFLIFPSVAITSIFSGSSGVPYLCRELFLAPSLDPKPPHCGA